MTKAGTTTSAGNVLEEAIPYHLKRTRTRPLSSPPGFTPKHASYSARFSNDVTTLPMVYVGLQFPPGTNVEPAIQTIEDGIAGSFGPDFHDRARYLDGCGKENLVFALYWRGHENHRRWRSFMPDGWWHAGLAIDGDIGAFEESYQPTVMDTETTFSHRHPEGYSVLADRMSGMTDTHEYWGSARDRIPRAQFDELAPGIRHMSDDSSGGDTLGRRITVQPNENLCLLRSGQDWSETTGAERDFYLNEVKPFLDTGMHEISDHGAAMGCHFNRYMQHLVDGAPVERTYSLSAWRSLADLEKWVRAETHLQIFGAGIRHFKKAGESAKLRLYHEMMVVRAADQSFTYFNCHNQTGMLRVMR